MSTLANSEDLDEMAHNVIFHQGLPCLLRQKTFSENEIQYYLEIITYDPYNPSMYTMVHIKCFYIKPVGKIHLYIKEFIVLVRYIFMIENVYSIICT